MVPLGIGSIISFLEMHGYYVKFVDFNFYKGDFEKDLFEWKPKVIGIGGTTPTRKASFKIAKICKKAYPNIPVVYGGVHATFTVKDTLTNVNEIDYIICGEGEYPFLSLCEIVIRNKPIGLTSIAGLCFRISGSIHISKPKRIEDLSKLPHPKRYYEGIDYKLKMDFANVESDFLITSRGCPVRCSFCSASTMFAGGVRFRDIEKIKKEVDEILINKDVKGLKIFDSTFTSNRDHVINFCEMIKSYNLIWECEVRADTIDYDLLKIMKDAGCYYVDIGLETTSERILKTISKEITLSQVQNVLEWSHKLGIKTKLFFIFGLMDQTFKECLSDLEFLRINRNKISLFANTIGLRVYPGTRIEKEMMKRGEIKPEFSWANYIPSKRNLLYFEISDTMILEQKHLSAIKLFLVAILTILQGTVLSKEHILNLLKVNYRLMIEEIRNKLNNI